MHKFSIKCCLIVVFFSVAFCLTGCGKTPIPSYEEWVNSEPASISVCNTDKSLCSDLDYTCSEDDPVCTVPDIACSADATDCSILEIACPTDEPNCNLPDLACPEDEPNCIIPDIACPATEPNCSNPRLVCPADEPDCIIANSNCPTSDPCIFTPVDVYITNGTGNIIYVYTGNGVGVQTDENDHAKVYVPEGESITIEEFAPDGTPISSSVEISNFGPNNQVTFDLNNPSNGNTVTVILTDESGQPLQGITVTANNTGGNIPYTTDATGTVIIDLNTGGTANSSVYAIGVHQNFNDSSNITTEAYYINANDIENNELRLTLKSTGTMPKIGLKIAAPTLVNVILPGDSVVPAETDQIIMGCSCSRGTSIRSSFPSTTTYNCDDSVAVAVPWFMIFDAQDRLIGYNMNECPVNPGDTSIDCPIAEVKTDLDTFSIIHSAATVAGVNWIDTRFNMGFANSVVGTINTCIIVSAAEIRSPTASQDCQMATLNTSTQSYEFLVPPFSDGILSNTTAFSETLNWGITGSASGSRQAFWTGSIPTIAQTSFNVPSGEVYNPPDNIAFDTVSNTLSWSVPASGPTPNFIVARARCTNTSNFNQNEYSEYSYITPSGTSHPFINYQESPLNAANCTLRFTVTSTSASTISDGFRSVNQILGGNTRGNSIMSITGYP